MNLDFENRMGWALPADILESSSQDLAAVLGSAPGYGVKLFEISLDEGTRVPIGALRQLAKEHGLRFSARLRARPVDGLVDDFIQIIREIGCSHVALDAAAVDNPTDQSAWLRATTSIGLSAAVHSSIKAERTLQGRPGKAHPAANPSNRSMLDLSVRSSSASDERKHLLMTGPDLAYLRLSLSMVTGDETHLDSIGAWAAALASCCYDGPVVCETDGSLETAAPLLKAARQLLRRTEKHEWQSSFRA